MRWRDARRTVLVGMLAVIMAVSAVWANAGSNQVATKAKRVVLVGASIGKEWRFEKVGERLGLDGYEFGYAGVYSFDKGAVIANVLGAPEKPDVVLLKECATYFPGELEDYKSKIKAWVATLRAAGVQPVLVTVAPIAESTDLVSRTKNQVKRLIGKQTWQQSIIGFNDWLKEYGRAERLPVFDLEAALRRGENDRWLRDEFDVGDKLHLNKAAYAAVDNAFAAFVVTQKGLERGQ